MNVLIDMPVYEPAVKVLKSLPGITVEIIQPAEERVRPLPKDLIENCDALLCTFPPENHQEMTSLKFLQISSAGYKQLTGQGFEERNVQAANALGVFDIPIAEWNITMMVNLARDARKLMHNQDAQIWDRSARFQHEIRGSVVGIWGYGGIGRETARLAKAMGLTVHVLTRSGVKPRENIYCVASTGDPDGIYPDKVYLADQKDEFLKGLDFLILAMPQTDNTEGIIGEHELTLLGPKSFLLNPARGPLVQENALINALNNKAIAGAALDTHYYYPMPPEHPLWKMNNVIMTPHISGSSSGPKFLERVYDIFTQNIQRILSGEPLLNKLRSEELKGS